ncbi:hypothetical protein B6U91_00550 [Candidatus Pacearchaeota archaeon ex4484_71]|nr:MAG: hypothetical protein B6U91_00550 [Candidatus Pacearchaeota archaeon ex4484_71]
MAFDDKKILAYYAMVDTGFDARKNPLRTLKFDRDVGFLFPGVRGGPKFSSEVLDEENRYLFYYSGSRRDMYMLRDHFVGKGLAKKVSIGIVWKDSQIDE